MHKYNHSSTIHDGLKVEKQMQHQQHNRSSRFTCSIGCHTEERINK
jgi:hypothetical protein